MFLQNLIINSYRDIRGMYFKKFCSEKQLIEKRFKTHLKREVNLEEPKKYNDKLQWLKLYWYDPLATKCADKYEVRSIVKDRIGEKYLNEIYGVYESVDDIDIDSLPETFVLKSTHGSGDIIICQDKNRVNWNRKFRIMRKWLKQNLYWTTGEWVYKDIRPRIICEKYIEQENGSKLRDYRVFCFNGKPQIITVDINITKKSETKRNIYDLNWNLLDAEISYPRELSYSIEKPKNLNKMLDLSRKLSNGFPHSRIDFYEVYGKVIFGEITFFHQSGLGKFSPSEFEVEMGEWLNLPKRKSQMVF